MLPAGPPAGPADVPGPAGAAPSPSVEPGRTGHPDRAGRVRGQRRRSSTPVSPPRASCRRYRSRSRPSRSLLNRSRTSSPPSALSPVPGGRRPRSTAPRCWANARSRPHFRPRPPRPSSGPQPTTSSRSAGVIRWRPCRSGSQQGGHAATGLEQGHPAAVQRSAGDRRPGRRLRRRRPRVPGAMLHHGALRPAAPALAAWDPGTAAVQAGIAHRAADGSVVFDPPSDGAAPVNLQRLGLPSCRRCRRCRPCRSMPSLPSLPSSRAGSAVDADPAVRRLPSRCRPPGLPSVCPSCPPDCRRCPACRRCRACRPACRRSVESAVRPAVAPEPAHRPAVPARPALDPLRRPVR